MGSDCFKKNGSGVSIWCDENILELDSADVCKIT